MKRNTIKIIISVILVHLLSACTPTDFLGDGSATLNFEVKDSTNQQSSSPGEIVTVSLDSQFITVKEGEEAQIGVKLNKISGSDIFVRLNTPGGEAKLGEDFLFESSTIHIPKGSLTASFKLKAIADAAVEQSETFFGELEVFQKDLAVVSGANLSVIIQDSGIAPPPPGNPIVSLLSASGVASEAQAVYQIPVVLDKVATQNIIINIGVDANSSAILGQDFVIQGGNSVTIPAGSQNAFIGISIIDDTVVEATPEIISLSLTSAVNATIGAPKQFQLTIMDNDVANPPPALPIASFSAAAASVSEAALSYNLIVSLDKPATQAVNIQYAIQSQSATLGADFSIAQGTSVSIPAGQQSGIIAITIINDTQAEPTEIFNVTLQSAVGASLSANRSFALSIIDNDAPQNNTEPLVSFVNASGAASEAQGNYSINLSLSKAAPQNVVVMLTMSGSALQNQDFSLPMGDNIVIPAGATSASLPITIIDDAANEQTETAVFTISSVMGGGAKVGAITSFSFSIMDNDAPAGVDKNLQAYTETLYNNIQRNPNTGRCFNCHRANGTQLQIAPYHSQDDPKLALQTIESLNLVNLDNPAASRLVTKVEGGHFPWSGSSIEDAALIASYIQMWADRVKAAGNGGGNPGNNNKISTNALMVSEGQEVQGTVRYTASQIAFWDFKKGADDKTIYDVSGVAPAVNLEMSGDIEWLGGQGITCNQNANGGKAQATGAGSKKIYDRINASKEFTVEAWISSTDKDQDGPTRIVSYSNGAANRNFTMGQAKEYFEFRNRNAKTGNNGSAPTYEPNDVKFVGDRPQNHHVVMVYDGRKRSLYVNGSLITGVDAAADNNVQDLNWNDNYNFLFCNETSDDRSFKGSIYMAAVHDKALSGAQVMQNYDSGFTKKLALQFDIAQHTNPGAKLNVQVEVQGSYLIFSKPQFSGLTSNVNVAGVSFAINQQEVAAGQSYKFIERPNMANATNISEVAAVIESADVGTDKISVNFQELGNKSQLAAPVLFPYEGDNTAVGTPEPTPPSALRLFSELYQSMANVTGVPSSNANTLEVYNEIKSGLPTDKGLDTFTSSHQINIIKLSYEYCNEMVSNTGLRNAFFGNINVSQPVNAAAKAQIADAVSKKAIGRNLATQASDAQVTQEVSGLVDEMLGFNRSTTDILKGACVLGLGSMNNLVK